MPDEREDIRNFPDEERRQAFFSGWTAAVNGNLYKSVREKKTHQNMGNLFGWIYGEQPREFKLATWGRYISAMDNSIKKMINRQ